MMEVSCDKRTEVLQVATELFEQGPDWVTFFREVLGIDGAVRRAFPDAVSLAAFEKSPEYDTIQHMLVKLRAQSIPPTEAQEPTRVITVRLPQSLHDSLRNEAHLRHTSMNKLCISKLLQVINDELVPAGTG